MATEEKTAITQFLWFYLDHICTTLVWVYTERLNYMILETRSKLGLEMLGCLFFGATKPNLQDFSLL